MGDRDEGLVWQSHERNEWSVSIEQALAASVGSPILTPNAPGPFSLADPATVHRILDTAGFIDLTLTEVNEPVFYGRDVAAALEWIRGFACTKEVLDRLDPAAAERGLERLRQTLAAHIREGGIWFDSRAWIVRARRP